MERRLILFGAALQQAACLLLFQKYSKWPKPPDRINLN